MTGYYMGYQKNDVIAVQINDIGNDGEGIGRVDGYTLFVKDAVIGDTIEARITKVKKNYGYARLEKIITPSPFRVAVKVCNLASVLSAKFNATASMMAGFLGEPNSYSPWWDKIQCFSSLARTCGNPSISRIFSPIISTPMIICPRNCPSSV